MPTYKTQTVQLRPEESFLQFVARQWAAFCFETLDAIRAAVLMFAWRYGCRHCNAKRFQRGGRGLLCARHFGELRRDIRKIEAYLAAAGRS